MQIWSLRDNPLALLNINWAWISTQTCWLLRGCGLWSMAPGLVVSVLECPGSLWRRGSDGDREIQGGRMGEQGWNFGYFAVCLEVPCILPGIHSPCVTPPTGWLIIISNRSGSVSIFCLLLTLLNSRGFRNLTVPWIKTSQEGGSPGDLFSTCSGISSVNRCSLSVLNYRSVWSKIPLNAFWA